MHIFSFVLFKFGEGVVWATHSQMCSGLNLGGYSGNHLWFWWSNWHQLHARQVPNALYYLSNTPVLSLWYVCHMGLSPTI